ncbi:MAG: hypothetical protein IJ971_01450 [Bacteroidales bacterium]|nr:hypothetical protein [Bacteroidales bacterium]
MITSRTYHSLHLDIVSSDSSSIIYILLPHRLPAEELTAIEELSTRFKTNIVAISEMDWNNDMTPWKAPAVKEGEFGGRASQFLDRLKGDIFFNLESSLQIRNPKRYLIGLSLAGLFSVWAGLMKPLFEGVASISGSFWYDGFAEWILKQEDLNCVRFHVIIGDKEKETKVKRFANIEEDTMKVVETLMLKGAEVAFEMTEGGHNSPVIPRIEKSVVSLFEKSVV